jgi:hypothetical protein
MKLYVDTSDKQVTVSKAPEEKKDQNGRQKTERETGRPIDALDNAFKAALDVPSMCPDERA